MNDGRPQGDLGDLSIIIPAFNEAEILPSILREINRVFPAAELVVVNDGGSDRTPDAVRGLDLPIHYLEHHPNRGKGFSIKRGVLESRGEVVVFTDADLPFGTEGIAAIIQALGEDTDIAIAEKRGESKGLGYRAARAVVRGVVRFLTGMSFPDTQAGLKGFKRPAALAVFGLSVIEGFATDIEMLYLAKRRGFVVRSVPLPLTDVYVRPSTFTPRKALRLLYDIWRIRRHRYSSQPSRAH
jgi:dolichyl-phosphate beta-glucosyltransferase